MQTNTRLIERYIYDVTRRLPEKERGEVKLELKTSINDMLPDNPTEQDEANVLTQLGDPGKLAERYRQSPKYLISPAMYDTYMSVVKNVIIIVACVGACAGAFIGVGSLDAQASAKDVFSAVLSEALSLTFECVFMALFWVTVGFVIADRSGYGDNKKKEWSLSDLPAVPRDKDVKIPRASTLVSMVLTVLFAGLYVVFLQRGWLFGGFMSFNGTEIVFPFSRTALERAVPLVIGVSVASLVLSAIKLYTARWDVKVLIGTVIYNACWLAAAAVVIGWTDLIDPQFIGKIGLLIDVDLSRYFAGGTVVYLPYALLVFIAIAAIDIGSAVWNTLKSR